jgi:hypothetical protein
MKARTLALFCMAAWTQGCTAQVHSVDDDTTGTGGQDAAGGAATGGSANVGGTSFLDEGEILLGSCIAPLGNGCRDFLTNSNAFTTEDAHQRCAESYTGGFSDELWGEGVHCPLVMTYRTDTTRAVAACKTGPYDGTAFAEVHYIYFSAVGEERDAGALEEYCDGEFYLFEE